MVAKRVQHVAANKVAICCVEMPGLYRGLNAIYRKTVDFVIMLHLSQVLTNTTCYVAVSAVLN